MVLMAKTIGGYINLMNLVALERVIDWKLREICLIKVGNLIKTVLISP